MKNPPKVSVLTTTYNQEKFIAKAIESVLMQKVNFDYELLIGEDKSTDKTKELIKKYAKKFPNRIKLISRKKNMGYHENLDRLLKIARGEYVAYLDGDDYWISKHKLQRQVNLLDKNNKFSMCFHSCRIIYENERKNSVIQEPREIKKEYDFQDIIKDGFIQTSAIMFRRKYFSKTPIWLLGQMCTDWGQYLLLSYKGKIGYIKEAMSAHRIHNQGIWSSLNKEEQYKYDKNILECLKNRFEGEYNELIEERLVKLKEDKKERVEIKNSKINEVKKEYEKQLKEKERFNKIINSYEKQLKEIKSTGGWKFLTIVHRIKKGLGVVR